MVNELLLIIYTYQLETKIAELILETKLITIL